MSKLYFMEILFQNDSYVTGTWIYQVRLLKPVFWYKADNCNICTKIVTLLFVLSSGNRAHVDQMSGTDVARPLHPI